MPTQPPVRVAIRNDHELVVAGIVALLAPFAARIEVVTLHGDASVDGDVDVLLIDSFGRPDDTGGDQLAGLDVGGSTKLLVLSWDVAPRDVRESLDAGAAGHLGKHVDGADLVRALERVRDGLVVTPDGAPQPPATVLVPCPG